MKLITHKRFTSPTSWTCPAGVSTLLVIPDNGVGINLDVTPNTSYSVLAGTSYPIASFGSAYQVTTSPTGTNLTIIWSE